MVRMIRKTLDDVGTAELADSIAMSDDAFESIVGRALKELTPALFTFIDQERARKTPTPEMIIGAQCVAVSIFMTVLDTVVEDDKLAAEIAEQAADRVRDYIIQAGKKLAAEASAK